jgi:hypothetical protein
MAKHPRIPTEAEVAALVSETGEIARGLAFERDMLRELVAAKDQYTACYKTGKRPSEKLFSTLNSLNAILFPEKEW